MQATVTSVTPAELARSLGLLWRLVSSNGDESSSFALIDELGLSLTQMKTLLILDQCVEAATVGELAERLGLSLASASRTVDGLARRGWIERREDEHDRRVKRVSVAPDGHAIAERITAARMQGLEAFAASLTDEERARLHAVITDLAPAQKD